MRRYMEGRRGDVPQGKRELYPHLALSARRGFAGSVRRTRHVRRSGSSFLLGARNGHTGKQILRGAGQPAYRDGEPRPEPPLRTDVVHRKRIEEIQRILQARVGNGACDRPYPSAHIQPMESQGRRRGAGNSQPSLSGNERTGEIQKPSAPGCVRRILPRKCLQPL